MTTPSGPVDARVRRLRWFGGAMAAAALLGLLQAANLIYSQGIAREAAQAVLRHEAEGWIRALAGHVRERDDSLTEEALQQFLDDSAAAGLRYVAVVGVETRREAGTPAAPLVFEDLPPGRLIWEGSRVRLSMAARSPRRSPADLGPGEGRRLRARPSFVVEFEPRAYTRLVADARRTLALGTITASTVVLLAVWAFLAMRRRFALEKETERARHLAALGEMSAVLAHEIRNPLALVKGNAQLLAEELTAAGTERARDKAARVVQEATRIEHITTDLLDFVRQGPLDLASTDLGALLRLSLVDVVPADRLQLSLPPTPLMVAVDAPRLRQVIENVGRNAVLAGDGPIDVELRKGAGAVELSVRDRGPGIPAGEQERIFEPFVTTRTRGTGLGLAIARRLTERHGGRLTAHNHPEGGAVFVLTLPAAG